MRRLFIALAALALVAGACGDSGTDADTSTAAAAHNEADVAFLQGMIPHHQQAIEMSDLALERSDNAEVTDLASRIKAAQGPEIQQMEGLLEEWGVEAAGGGHGGGHGGGGGHPGMLSQEQLDQLAAAEGTEFDRLFLTGMIEHHRGAVTASEKVLAEGESEETPQLAQQIIDAQEAEIAEMEGVLEQL